MAGLRWDFGDRVGAREISRAKDLRKPARDRGAVPIPPRDPCEEESFEVYPMRRR
jgi:hypothetical protein